MKTTLFALPCIIALLVSPIVHAAANPPSTQTSSFDSDGVKIAYVVAGGGEPVVLIHGLNSSAMMNWQFPGIFKMLAEHYRVIALDLRGHGRSDKPGEDDAYGLPMAEDIIRLMDHLKIERAHIVGYSLGGMITMRLMVDHPDRVISGTLGGMGWLKTGSRQQTYWEKAPAKEGARTPPACVHGIGKLAVSETELKEIRLPVEIIVGDRDPCRQWFVEPLEEVRKDFPVVEIEGAGHLSCVMKEQFKTELLKWIDKNAKP